MHSARRTAAAAVISLVMAAGLAACGESGGAADVRPAGGPTASSAPSATASASPTATATASRTTAARSGLEEQAPVQAARSWAAAVAVEVNQRSTSHTQTRRFTTARGARTLPKTYTSDYGLRYPGPLPFTPLSATISGRTARVPACIKGMGWAINADGIAPQQEVVYASTFVLKKRGDQWKLDAITGRQESCDGVTVKGYSR